jgi:hypothetical protein
MKSLRFPLLALCLVLLATSCTTFKASGLAYAPAGTKYTVLGDFHTTIWVNEFLGSSGGAKLLNLSADATEGPIQAAIAKEVEAKGGTGAINVTIVHQASFVNLLLNGFTGAIYAPSTVIISGTVIK